MSQLSSKSSIQKQIELHPTKRHLIGTFAITLAFAHSFQLQVQFSSKRLSFETGVSLNGPEWGEAKVGHCASITTQHHPFALVLPLDRDTVPLYFMCPPWGGGRWTPRARYTASLSAAGHMTNKSVRCVLHTGRNKNEITPAHLALYAAPSPRHGLI